MSDITIRRATIDDHAAACALLDSLHAFHHDRAPWLFNAPGGDPDPRGRFAAILAGGDTAFFVADAAGGIAGIAQGSLRSAPDPRIFAVPRWGVLEGLVVAPAWRRRGVGRLLAEAVETWAHERGAPWVELNVYEFNADARRFYESLGYLPHTAKLRKPWPGTA